MNRRVAVLVLTIAACLACTLTASPSQAVPFLAGDFLTFTQADWGDPIPLLTANYNTVYAPFGIFEIGIPGSLGFSITFTSAASLAAFLPAIGPPGALDSDLADPIGSSS